VVICLNIHFNIGLLFDFDFILQGCDTASTELGKVKNEMGDEVTIGALKCVKFPSVCQEQEISTTTPVFKLFAGVGKAGVQYTGTHKYFAMLTFLDLSQSSLKDEL
jgi:hypothetical protein